MVSLLVVKGCVSDRGAGRRLGRRRGHREGRGLRRSWRKLLLAVDANTIALYLFDGNFNDSSANALNLTTAGSVLFNSGNTTCMQTPSGSVALRG